MEWILGFSKAEFGILHDKKHSAKGKHIDWWSLIRTRAADFRRHVIECAAACDQSLGSFPTKYLIQAKISDFHACIFVHEEIFELKVPMANVMLVDVLYAREDLAKKLSDLTVIQTSGRLHVIKSFSVYAHFTRDVKYVLDGVPILFNLTAASCQHGQNIWMFHSLRRCINLCLKSLFGTLIEILEYLDSHIAVVPHVNGQIGCSKVAVTKYFE